MLAHIYYQLKRDGVFYLLDMVSLLLDEEESNAIPWTKEGAEGLLAAAGLSPTRFMPHPKRVDTFEGYAKRGSRFKRKATIQFLRRWIRDQHGLWTAELLKPHDDPTSMDFIKRRTVICGRIGR
jgi:hypothetical protein